jgi:hypothetical protein
MRTPPQKGTGAVFTAAPVPPYAQSALYPEELASLVKACSYRQGWGVYLDDIDRGQGCSGLTLTILVVGPDSYPPHDTVQVRHLFPVPAAAYDRRSWRRWLFERYLEVERHEAMEWFTLDGEKPYAPNHGPGSDPYIVAELSTERERRTSFRGEHA